MNEYALIKLAESKNADIRRELAHDRLVREARHNYEGGWLRLFKGRRRDKQQEIIK